MAAIPIEKDAILGPAQIEILARVAAGAENADRAIAALQKLLSIPYESQLAPNVPVTPALLRLDPMLIRSGMIRASKNSPSRPRRRRRTNKATRRSAISSLS